MATVTKRVWNETLTFLALVFLITFSYPAFEPNISSTTQSNLDLLQWIIWGAFALDLLIGLVTATNRKQFIIKHPLDIAAVLLPFLRPLRLLRVISFGGLALQKVAIGRQFAITVKVFQVFLLLISQRYKLLSVNEQ
jgi:voltage-gated potassium channel